MLCLFVPYLPLVAQLEARGRLVVTGLSSPCSGKAEVTLHH
jgi:hypothetical protein